MINKFFVVVFFGPKGEGIPCSCPWKLKYITPYNMSLAMYMHANIGDFMFSAKV